VTSGTGWGARFKWFAPAADRTIRMEAKPG
jgi:hypothetical protein